MDVDRILETFNRHQVAYLLIGGMNFLLRHQPVLTFDVELWVEDSGENRRRCEQALADLGAEWGATEESWGFVGQLPSGWLDRQLVYCLTSPAGPINIFRRVTGRENWSTSAATAPTEATGKGIPYRGLSDADMLRCQYALPPGLQKRSRVDYLLKMAGGGP